MPLAVIHRMLRRVRNSPLPFADRVRLDLELDLYRLLGEHVDAEPMRFQRLGGDAS